MAQRRPLRNIENLDPAERVRQEQEQVNGIEQRPVRQEQEQVNGIEQRPVRQEQEQVNGIEQRPVRQEQEQVNGIEQRPVRQEQEQVNGIEQRPVRQEQEQVNGIEQRPIGFTRLEQALMIDNQRLREMQDASEDHIRELSGRIEEADRRSSEQIAALGRLIQQLVDKINELKSRLESR